MSKKFDIKEVQYRTNLQKLRINKYLAVIKDAGKKSRLENQECVICYYDNPIGAAVMTQSACALCGYIMCHYSSATDMLCIACAQKNRLCKHCGADIDLKDMYKL